MTAAWLLAAALLAPSPGAADRPRFVRVRTEPEAREDWVAIGAGVSAHGAGRVVHLGELTYDPGDDVIDAAFVGRRFFVALAGGGLRELRREHESWAAMPFVPSSGGRLHLTSMDTWLVVAEDGAGLHFQPIRGGQACHGTQAQESELLPLNERFVALAASLRTVYAATASGKILEIDAADPSHALAVRSIPHDGVIRALAASGSRLYVLDRDALWLLSLGPHGVVSRERHAEIQGSSIQVGGRTLRIAGEQGVATYEDRSPSAQTFDVSAEDDFFSPQDLTVALGDTVRWTNVTGSLHNVISCSPSQAGCYGATATEEFTSGPATGIWSVEHTFTQPGSNPYVCGPHQFFMTGSVTVTGAIGAPPAVPDGSFGTPMTAGKMAQDGSTLSISWDTATCRGAANYEILYGYAYGLPGSTGGGFELAGSSCSIGVSSPFTWTGAPTAFPGPSGFVFWLVVATDGAATEGSWGKDSAGNERQGPADGGASGECGMAVKNVTNACP